ncbi:hypothetical protein Pmani_005252 [Petrolisthes manimaculis]|uniref:Uncharacterized protein n=1 Tax=Petrolisthes manimaculis TaxID=1843537 RepID=A0AAE1UN40_9EUCA|nr:hypothetical protein Pmani_005252 [Petrolisthes manimaculis]
MSYDKSRKRNESKSDTAGEARGDDGKGRRDGVGGMESRERREAGRRGKGRQVVGLGWDDWKRKGGKAGGGERRGCLKEGGGRYSVFSSRDQLLKKTGHPPDRQTDTTQRNHVQESVTSSVR